MELLRSFADNKNDMQFSTQSNSNKLSSISRCFVKKERMQFHFEITLLCCCLKSFAVPFSHAQELQLSHEREDDHNLPLLHYCTEK